MERLTYQNKQTKEIVVVLGEATAVKSNSPVVIYMSLTSEDNNNKVRTHQEFHELFKEYKIK